MTDHGADTGGEQSSGLSLELRRLLPQAGGSASGALIGLAIGGPPGAAAGAFLAPAGSVVAALAHEALRRRRQRATEVFAEAAALRSQSPDDFGDQLCVDEPSFEFAMEILTSAAEEPLAEKRRAYARLLGNPEATEQVAPNFALLLARALAAMDETHVNILRKVAEGTGNHVNPPEAAGTSADDLATSAGVDPTLLRYYVRLLELFGLITDAAGKQGPIRPPRWQITALGSRCLELLS